MSKLEKVEKTNKKEVVTVYINRNELIDKVSTLANKEEINITEDTMLRGLRAATRLRFENGLAVFKMGMNDYTLQHEKFSEFLHKLLEEFSGPLLVEKDREKEFIAYDVEVI